jgi:hypothetical protein
LAGPLLYACLMPNHPAKSGDLKGKITRLLLPI